MSIDIRDNYDIESFYQEFNEPDCSGNDKQEESICIRCLELVEECECQLYDKVEEVELAHERAEIAMGQLMPIEIEVRTISR